MLQKGSKGSEVILMQKALVSTKLLQESGVDGDFGPTTDAAVRKFQDKHGLVVDGKVGPSTKELLTKESGIELDLDADNDAPSNCIVVNGKRIAVPAELGVTVTNYLDDDEFHFVCRKRVKKLEHIVIHESVTTKKSGTVSVLRGKDLGIQLILASDGKFSQHNDFATEQVPHGNQLNGSSIGLEVINPYSPAYANSTYSRVIPAQWWTWVPKGKKKEYTLPTQAQEKALKAFLPWLTKQLGIPLVLPTINNTDKIKGWDKGAKPPAGIVSHYDYSSHADGRYPLELLKDVVGAP